MVVNTQLNENTQKFSRSLLQPLGVDIPPFCLACLGTDQRFTAQHVLQRWKYIRSQCAEKGISVVSFGGDGDSKVMKV